MYYNVHTHPHAESEDVLFIENLYKHFDQEIKEERKVSMGLHPWYLHLDHLDEQFAHLAANAGRPQVLAIGECGLDKLSSTDWDLQLNAFQRQIKLAQDLKKPLLVHCVRAFHETLNQLSPAEVPVIFHGVNNKLSLIQPVIDAGYYLSFGKSLLGGNTAILNTFKATPLEKVFLETDDSTADIREIYKAAAEIRGISENELALQLEKNFLTVFNH